MITDHDMVDAFGNTDSMDAAMGDAMDETVAEILNLVPPEHPGAPTVDPDDIDRVLAGHQISKCESEVAAGIKLSKHQKDVFHMLQDAAIGFGTTSPAATALLKCVSDVLLVHDPVTKKKVIAYLKRQHEEAGESEEEAAVAARLEYHGYATKNPQ